MLHYSSINNYLLQQFSMNSYEVTHVKIEQY